MKLLALALALLAPAPAATLYRIACGSSTGGTDAAGHAWQADAFFQGGTAYATPALAALDLPYRTLRYGANAFSYTIPVAPGKYTITLSFIENRTAASVPPVAAGQRKFSVTANGTAVVADLDLFAIAGSMHPYSVSASVTVASGPLVLSVAPTLGNALLSGIQVDSVDVPPPPPATVAQWYCENGDPGTGMGVGALAPGVQHLISCENMSMAPVHIVRVRVRADGAGAVLDLMTPDATGQMQSLLAAPVPSSESGNEAAALSGAVYPPGAVLHWMLRINDSGDPAIPPATYALATVVLENAPATAANQLVKLDTCTGSGLSFYPDGKPVLDPKTGLQMRWDCAGLFRATIQRADGSLMPLTGSAFDVPIASATAWVPVK